MDQSRQRMKKRGEAPTCPFCQQTVARPCAVELTEIDGLAAEHQGGRCACGALFLLDATGREGGQLLMDGLAALCGGDVDQALSLRADEDYALSSVGYNPRMHTTVPQTRGRSFGQPKLWFFKLLSP